MLRIQMDVPWQDEAVQSPPLSINPADRLFPLQDHDELFRVKANARSGEMVLQEPEFAFELYLAEEESVEGEPLFDYLENTLSHVGRICVLFGKHVLAWISGTSKLRPNNSPTYRQNWLLFKTCDIHMI